MVWKMQIVKEKFSHNLDESQWKLILILLAVFKDLPFSKHDVIFEKYNFFKSAPETSQAVKQSYKISIKVK